MIPRRHLTPWATEWVEEFDSDEPDVERLVVVEAESAADARRESGLIEHEFAAPTDEQKQRWVERTERALSVEDIDLLGRLLSREARGLARGRAKTYAIDAGLIARGVGSHVLTPEGRRRLAEAGITVRGVEPAPLLDLLVRDGIPFEEAPNDQDTFRARKFTELRGKLHSMLEEARQEREEDTVEQSR